MNPRLKSLIWAFLIGAFVALLIVLNLPHKDVPPPVDLQPYRDSIRAAEREYKLAEDRSKYHLRRADSLQALLVSNKKKLKHDIQIIEALSSDSARLWHDSLMRSVGLR